MSVADQIIQQLNQLSEIEQNEVLDFMEYLQTRSRERRQNQNTEGWAAFSLKSAMRGLVDEPVEYTIEDLRETF